MKNYAHEYIKEWNERQEVSEKEHQKRLFQAGLVIMLILNVAIYFY